MHPIGRLVAASHALPLAAIALPVPAAPLLIAWAAVQAAFVTELLRPGSRSLAPNICRGPAGSTGVALTFDDGPRDGETERLLDRLQESNVRVAFFFVGRHARALPRAVRRAAADGHVVGNHTDTHPASWSVATRRRVLAEIGDAQSALADVTGEAPRWFRPPVGHKNVYMKEALERHGLRQVTWSLRSYDTVLRDRDRTVGRVLRRVRGGDVVLLHEGLTDGAGGAPLSLAATPPILAGLAERRLRTVSLQDLLRDPPASPPATAPPPERGSGEPAR